jgi:hypothetical protein
VADGAADNQKNKDRKADGPESAKRFAHEYFDFDPRQFPETAQHHFGGYSLPIPGSNGP